MILSKLFAYENFIRRLLRIELDDQVKVPTKTNYFFLEIISLKLDGRKQSRSERKFVEGGQQCDVD